MNIKDYPETLTLPQVLKIMNVSRVTFYKYRPRMARMGVKFYQPFGPHSHYRIETESFFRYWNQTLCKQFTPGG